MYWQVSVKGLGLSCALLVKEKPIPKIQYNSSSALQSSPEGKPRHMTVSGLEQMDLSQS